MPMRVLNAAAWQYCGPKGAGGRWGGGGVLGIFGWGCTSNTLEPLALYQS